MLNENQKTLIYFALFLNDTRQNLPCLQIEGKCFPLEEAKTLDLAVSRNYDQGKHAFLV